jgi:hypothetical protein
MIPSAIARNTLNVFNRVRMESRMPITSAFSSEGIAVEPGTGSARFDIDVSSYRQIRVLAYTYINAPNPAEILVIASDGVSQIAAIDGFEISATSPSFTQVYDTPSPHIVVVVNAKGSATGVTKVGIYVWGFA